ncbi:cilia- and flagella-associated protein 43-like [Formica exsecta]|uniref:cilia- and flagella-associated protein 43-like n=1 Tax=Formica exsecta TaxID=72781 RepID=UPI001143B919|nr:cilia- and flagella-associated protein 43-like [Formica exsecta]
MQAIAAHTKWVKFGKSHDFVFVGKETIATASGIYVSFLDLNTRERRIERFDSKERGDGASCLAGHPTVSMFSVVERKSNPKISIFIYPTLRRISRCVLPDKINGYSSCSFAGTEYLISLTNFPDFRLIVWLWKTGKHVAMLNMKIHDLVQEICCSPNPPHLISQLGIVDGTLSICQIRTCSKIVSIHHVDVPVPEHKIVSSSWTPEGNLFASDEFGNVWLIAIDANKLYSVVKSKTLEPSKNRPIVITYRTGVIVVNTDSEITFYKKSLADWNVSWQFVWSISTFHSIRVGRQYYFEDGILFHSNSGEIFEISTQYDNVPHIEIIYTDEIEYKALFSISQRADHVAAIDRLDRLCIFEVSTGKLTARLSLKHHGEVVRADSHPTLSMLVACSVAGNCIFIDITSLPKIFNCFHLYGDVLDRIKFSHCGKFLGIGSSQTGKLFIIGKRFEQQPVDVLGFIEIDGYVADFLIYKRNNGRFEILVLATTNPSMASIGGNKVIVYTCEISNNFYTRAICAIDLLRPFRMLYHGTNKPLNILGIPSLSKQLHQMEIQDDFQDIILTEALFSIHQMRNIGIYMTDSRVLTYGYDGLIVVRDSMELRKVIAVFMPHHRSKGGIKCAISSRFGEMIVSLGRNGDLVASRVRLSETRTNLAESRAVSVHLSIEDFTSGSNKLYGLAGETWLENVIAAKLKAERDEALPLRASIIADLEKIKNQIRELLDINESKPPDARLPISAFDLNRESRQRKIEEARLERDKVHRKLEEECAQRDQVASYIREIFWESLQVKPCALKSIGGDTIIRNYPLVASTRRMNEFKVWDRLSSEADEFLYSYEVYNESVDEEDDSRQGSAASDSDKEASTNSSDEIKIHEVAKTWYTMVDEDERLCISGITTYKWIDDESIAATHQLLLPCDRDLKTILKKDIIIENRERKLKMYFINLFEEMRRAKERELKCTKERIDRLRYCASELKTMFGIDSVLERIDTPTWSVEEISDYIVTVKDHEILAKQSRREESRIATVDEDREDEEKNGNSDFYEKALEKMMDGVLESKWEDEVKKEIPVPECITAKDPSKYTDEDIAIIASYKFKVQALKEERKKYKATLQAEIVETKEALQRDITEFNDKLKDLELKKMQIECAILQERLTRIRAIRRHRSEVDGRQKIVRFTDDELVPATREARKLAEECNSLEVVVAELKSRYDNLNKAEKRQETKFRSEFADLKQPIVEHLLRHYKKRPRIGRLITTSVTYLTEVVRCVAASEKSDILPRECLDFLRGIDALDTMPRNLPPQININHWRTMCKLRRAKVEVETKVRCCAVEMAEAEQTLSFYQKTMQSADNVVACKKVCLENIEKSLMQLAEEMEIQLVLKMGQIEVPLQGCPSDYENTVLVTREELLRVNECIIETGRSKLAAMHKSMHLRKVVSQQEWQHARAKMVLDDLQQELKDVQQFKITRNVLEFLSRDPCSVNLEKDYEKIKINLRIFQNRFRELLALEKARLKETKRLMAKWKKKNDKMSKELKSKSSDVEEFRKLLNDPCRKKDEESRKMRLAAIARRTKLIIKAENNYEQLLALHAHLEVLKLRTYPTLQFKTA